MVILKLKKGLKLNQKAKGSTLMETLVATVIIVIIFMIASMTLNNLFSNTIKNNTRAIEAHLNQLQYQHQNNLLSLPYQDSFEYWNINVSAFKENNNNYIEFEATNTQTNKTITIVNETAAQ